MPSGYEKLTGYLRNLFGIDVSGGGVTNVEHTNRIVFGPGITASYDPNTGYTTLSTNTTQPVIANGSLDIINSLGISSTAGFRLDETIYEEDFGDITKLGIGLSSTSSGASAGVSAGNILELNGTMLMTTGSTATGSVIVEQSACQQFRLRHGEVLTCFIVRTLTAISTAANAFKVTLGLVDGATITNGVTLVYTHDANAGQWSLDNTADGVTTSVATGVTVATGTIYRIAIVTSASGSSTKAFINGALVATNAGTIPAGTVKMGLTARIVKSAGTGFSYLHLSKIKARIVNTYELMV